MQGTGEAAQHSPLRTSYSLLHSTPPPPRLQDAVKVMAKSLVRNRHSVTKMYGLKSQLQAVSLRLAVCGLLLHVPKSLVM